MRILVVESDAMRYSVAGLLAACFAQVRAVPDGKAAVESFYTFRPHLVVLNLGYAVADRVQTWDHIRSGGTEVRHLLVVLSDSRSRSDEIDALDMGADEYLKKPISASRLCCRVQTILRRAFDRRRLASRCELPPPSRPTAPNP